MNVDRKKAMTESNMIRKARPSRNGAVWRRRMIVYSVPLLAFLAHRRRCSCSGSAPGISLAHSLPALIRCIRHQTDKPASQLAEPRARRQDRLPGLDKRRFQWA